MSEERPAGRAGAATQRDGAAVRSAAAEALEPEGVRTQALSPAGLPSSELSSTGLLTEPLAEGSRRQRGSLRSPADPDLHGQVLDGRYRLESLLGSDGPVALWRGTDLVLARAVAVRILVHDGALDDEPMRLLAAARHAGRLVHPGGASTYEATTTPTGGTMITYVVTEWVKGRSLSAMLHEGPLPPSRAVWIVHAVAHVLAMAHQRGVAHGDLRPSDVIVTPHGQVKLLDLEVRAALTPGQPSFAERSRRDLYAVAALLYAALTARWPGSGSGSGSRERTLAAAPLDDAGRVCTARQVRAGVPRDLDALAAGLLQPGSSAAPPVSMQAFVDRLERSPVLARSDAGAQAERIEPGTVPLVPVRLTPARRRRRGYLAGGVAAVLLVAALLLGATVGHLPGAPQGFPSAAVTSSPAPLGPPLPLTSVHDFDPEGADRSEQPGRVPLAHDGNPGTAWFSDTYTSAAFGQLKSGVGLVVDLGSPRRVRQVELMLGAPGGALQLRTADTYGAAAADFSVVAAADPAPSDLRLTPSDTRPHRYWLIWFTRLPATAGGFRADVAEMAFLP